MVFSCQIPFDSRNMKYKIRFKKFTSHVPPSISPLVSAKVSVCHFFKGFYIICHVLKNVS